MRGKLLVAVFVVVAAVTVAGCGGSARQAESTNRISIPAYGVVPARTATATTASAAVCRTDAGTLVRDARGFLHHFGPAAAYPADLNYVIVRDDLARFRSDGCAPAVLGRALSSGLTPAQRNALVTNLPSSMAQALRTALSDAWGQAEACPFKVRAAGGGSRASPRGCRRADRDGEAWPD